MQRWVVVVGVLAVVSGTAAGQEQPPEAQPTPEETPADEPMPAPDAVVPVPTDEVVQGEPDVLEAACRGGKHKECYAVGAMYLAGRGVARDVDRGLALLGTACEYGSGIACHTLGDLRANGVFAQPDPEGAGPFYRRACLLGRQASCSRVRVEYVEGKSSRRLVQHFVDPLDVVFYAQTGLAQIRPEPVRFPTAGTVAFGIGGDVSRGGRFFSPAAAADFVVGMTGGNAVVFDVRLAGGAALRSGKLTLMPYAAFGVDGVGANITRDSVYHLPAKPYAGAEVRARMSLARALVHAGAAYLARIDDVREIRLEGGVGWRASGKSTIAFTVRANDLDGALMIGGFLSISRAEQY